mgnify:FL=1
MFSITLICMGKLKEHFYTEAAAEYAKRLRAYCDFQLIELPECRLPEDPNDTQIAQGLQKEAELIRAKKLLTLASSRYILVEFAFNEDSIEMNSCLEQIFAEGLTPVIAHPERYNAVQRDRTLPERWFASGYVLQVNKDSIFGGLGQRAKRTAEFILSQGLAHIAASDAHSTYSRNPELARLREHISLNYSEDYAQILLEENPKRIIENQPMLRA